MDKKKKIIVAAVAVLVAVAVAATWYFTKDLNKKPQDTENPSKSSDTQNSTPTDQSKDVKIENSGVVEGIYTVDGVDYVSNLNGIYKVTADSKTALTDQKTTHRFTIINNVIYYTVPDATDKFDGPNGKKFDWQKSSCWKMNLDGSEKEKLFSYYGCGYVVYADDNNIYYADEGVMGVFTSAYGNYLNKYNLETKETSLIFDGKTTSSTSIDNEANQGLSDFIYVDGNIIFHTTIAAYLAEPDIHTYRYNIKEDKVHSLDFGSVGVFKKNESTVYLCAQTAIENPKPDEESYYFKLKELNVKTNKINDVFDFGRAYSELSSVSVKADSDKNIYLYPDARSSSETNLICFCDLSTGKVEKIKRTDVKDTVDVWEWIYSDDESDETTETSIEIARYKDGKRTVLDSFKPNEREDLRVGKVGANCAIIFGYDYENDFLANPTSYFHCREFYFTKNS